MTSEEILQDIEKAIDRLYANVPTGEVHAFELIKVIKAHLSDLDLIIQTIRMDDDRH